MDEDSRTATFDRKRPHDVITLDEGLSTGSTSSTPRKRNKLAGKLGHQDVRDFVPIGGSFTTSNVPLEELHSLSGESRGTKPVTEVPASETAATTSDPPSDSEVGTAANEERRLFLENLDSDTTEDDIRYFISEIESEGVFLSPKPQSAGHFRHAFVNVPTRQAAEIAIDKLHGKILHDRKIAVRRAGKPYKNLAFTANDLGIDGEDGSDGSSDQDLSKGKIGSDQNNGLGLKSSRPLNWNAVNNFTVRTTLGAGSGTDTRIEKADIQKSQEYIPIERRDKPDTYRTPDKENDHTNSDPETTQEKAAQVTLARLEGFRGRLARMDPHDGPVSAYRAARSELENAEVDYNYCVYYPVTESWSPPPSSRKRSSAGELTITGAHTVTQQKRIRIWNLVKTCMKQGTLLNLKDGKTAGVDRGKTRSVSDLGNNRGPSYPTIRENLAPVNDQAIVINDSAELEGVSHTHDNKSESDGGLVSNTYSDPTILSEGEISGYNQERDRMIDQSHRKTADCLPLHDTMDNEAMSEDSSSDADSDSEFEDDEATVGYSNSDAAPMDETTQLAHSPLNLAELSAQDLDAQIRYFHVTRSNSEVDLNTPVRCLVCSFSGHLANKCKELTCNVCSSFNHHVTQDCPLKAKCPKCREMGHTKASCPYKLKTLTRDEIVCDLCERTGHIEEDCELTWRTSGRPWDSDLVKRNLRLSCYECGRSGHLGNDCPSRRPGKSLGTSTWGSGEVQISIKSKNEISIKGSARQDPIDIDCYEEEMTGNFIRPKIGQPARKGNIQIKTGPKPSSTDKRPYSGRTPVNVSYNGDSTTLPPRGDWRAPVGSGQTMERNRQQYNNYRPVDRRSLSPEYRDRSSYNFTRPDRHQPQAQQATYSGRRAGREIDTYRPMPNSAQNAWSRHRV